MNKVELFKGLLEAEATGRRGAWLLKAFVPVVTVTNGNCVAPYPPCPTEAVPRSAQLFIYSCCQLSPSCVNEFPHHQHPSFNRYILFMQNKKQRVHFQLYKILIFQYSTIFETFVFQKLFIYQASDSSMVFFTRTIIIFIYVQVIILGIKNSKSFFKTLLTAKYSKFLL